MTALVQLALALLIAAQQAHVPAELRAQAIHVATLAISISETYEAASAAPLPVQESVTVDAGSDAYARELAAIESERAALIAERDALHRKAEEMGGSRDWIAAYKGILTKEVKARMEALNERESALRAEYRI